MKAKPKAKLRWVSRGCVLVDGKKRVLGVASFNYASNEYDLWVGGLPLGCANNEVCAKAAVEKAVRGKK